MTLQLPEPVPPVLQAGDGDVGERRSVGNEAEAESSAGRQGRDGAGRPARLRAEAWGAF